MYGQYDFSHFGQAGTAIPAALPVVVAPIVKTRKPRKAKSEQTQPAKHAVTHCQREPITIWYSARGVTPTRSVAYRKIAILADFGFAAIGTIEFAGETRYVERTNGAWELSQPIAPFMARSK